MLHPHNDMDDSVFIQLLSPQRAAFFFHCITKSQVAQREGQREGQRERGVSVAWQTQGKLYGRSIKATITLIYMRTFMDASLRSVYKICTPLQFHYSAPPLATDTDIPWYFIVHSKNAAFGIFISCSDEQNELRLRFY